MNKTAIELQLWRIPCVLHMLNLIFQDFVKAIMPNINPIFDLIKHLTNSEIYENQLFQKSILGIKIKKIPTYVETRWTSFCDSVITLYDTLAFVKEITPPRRFLDQTQLDYLSRLNKLCIKYKNIILTYEEDSFGASGCFLADISLIKQLFTDVENTDLRNGSIAAKKRIDDLSRTHSFFWNSISPIALILNPQIEDYKRLLTTDQIDIAKKTLSKE